VISSLAISGGEGSFVGIFGLEGEVRIDVRVVRHCMYVGFLERSIIFFVEKLKFTYVEVDISTEYTFGSAIFCKQWRIVEILLENKIISSMIMRLSQMTVDGEVSRLITFLVSLDKK